MKLFLVRCQGMQTTTGGQVAHGCAYVAAEDSHKAYMKLREYLDVKDIGFAKDRELLTVELIGDENECPQCGVRFYP